MKGVITALDFGDRRIGVARCDSTRTLVTPVAVLKRSSPDKDRARLNEIISEQDSVMILVGLPLNMNGSEGTQVDKVRKDASLLLDGRPEPIVFYDERLTTFQAERIQESSGAKSGEDAVAAAVLLDDYLRSRGTAP